MQPRHNIIRGFALVSVAVTSGFVMYMIVWLTNLLSDPAWCDRAIGAAKGNAARPESAFGGCFALLTQQMSALAINSYIFGGVVALCLGALMVIVVAGGRISFSASRDGVSGNLGSATDPLEAAAHVREGAERAEQEVRGDNCDNRSAN